MFLLHFHAFVFVFFTLLLMVEAISVALPVAMPAAVAAGFAAAIYTPLYLYKAMRRVYAQGRFKTLMKYVFLVGSYFVSSLVAFLVLVVVTALTI